MADQEFAKSRAWSNINDERSSTIRDYVSVVFRRRTLLIWTFLGTLLGAVALTVAVMNYRYVATMKVVVAHERFDPMVTPGHASETSQQMNVDGVTQTEVASETSILQDEDLLKQVVVDLHLQEGKGWGDYVLFFMHFTPEERVAFALSHLQSKLNVTQETNANLIDVTYVTYWDQNGGAKILNTLGKLYLQKHMEIHSPPGALDFFEKETARYQQGLAEAEARLVSYDRQHEAVSAHLERDDLVNKLSDFYAALGQTRVQLAQTEERIRNLDQQLASTPDRMDTLQQTTDAYQLLEQEKSTLLNLELKRTDLLTKYDSNYPLVREVEKQIAETREAIAQAEKSPTHSLATDRDPTHEFLREDLAKTKADLAQLNGNETGTLKAIQGLQSKAVDLDQEALNQKDLLREAKVEEDNYLLYLQKREDTRITVALNATKEIANVAIAQPALSQVLPHYSPWLCLLVGFLLSVMVSLGSVVAAEYFDPAFQTPDQVIEYLTLPVIASIPKNRASS